MVSPSLENAIRIDYLLSSIFSQKAEVVHEAVWNEHFHDDIPYDTGGSNNNADKVLMSTERYKFKCFATILNNEQLKKENTNHNYDEEIVDKDILEDI